MMTRYSNIIMLTVRTNLTKIMNVSVIYNVCTCLYKSVFRRLILTKDSASLRVTSSDTLSLSPQSIYSSTLSAFL